MAMKGKRIIMFQEGKDDMKIDTNFLKELTGGDSINGRALYGDTEEFDINGIVIVSRNRPPKFNRVDPPLIRRNRTIACETQFKYEITEKHHRLIRDDIDMTELKYSFFQLLIENYNPDMKKGIEACPTEIQSYCREFFQKVNSFQRFIAEYIEQYKELG